MLKESPCKGVIHSETRKLNPWYNWTFQKILERIGPVHIKLELPKAQQCFHNTFHVSNLKKCLSDESLFIPMKELRLDDKLNFVEKPAEIMDREVKKLKQSRIPIVKGLEYGRYGVLTEVNTAYQGFLGVGTTFGIFQNLHILYLEYGVLVFSGYDILILFLRGLCHDEYSITSLARIHISITELRSNKFKKVFEQLMARSGTDLKMAKLDYCSKAGRSAVQVLRIRLQRLRHQDIEDMLLFLVQGKLANLNLDERFALNVALRLYTRRIVIQERVEDLQLAVESYQKKINLSRPDSYRSDLRKMTPYTAYHNIQGIIYQDVNDINRLVRTDELYKFSDGTLNHVLTALNDIATGIQMEYLPKRK
ncbi:hypothetical protein Tco_0769054 [Tanacetum coccineum]|uniref:Tf2-1-like SH3-like domain-containing protein n=1 Tax=Tanacetum coccineum TaxID=301880 RepID=A0ABQ4ZBY9_9ASTR